MVLVELEVIHFTDAADYTVIKDLEQRQASIINAETRKLVAMQRKEADIVESTARKDTAVQVANNDELAKIREITRDEAIGKRGAEKEKTIAEQQGMANKSAIASQNILLVGKADNEKQALIVAAEGKSQSEILLTATVPAEKVRMGGIAEADAIRAKLFADADGTFKRAEALKLYNEAGIKLEYLKAIRDVEMNKADNWGKAMTAAKINVYSGGEGGNLFGMAMSPSGAFSLGAFSAIAKESGGIDLERIAESVGGKALPIIDLAKVTPTGKNPPEKAK
jgi:flotillin